MINISRLLIGFFLISQVAEVVAAELPTTEPVTEYKAPPLLATVVKPSGPRYLPIPALTVVVSAANPGIWLKNEQIAIVEGAVLEIGPIPLKTALQNLLNSTPLIWHWTNKSVADELLLCPNPYLRLKPVHITLSQMSKKETEGTWALNSRFNRSELEGRFLPGPDVAVLDMTTEEAFNSVLRCIGGLPDSMGDLSVHKAHISVAVECVRPLVSVAKKETAPTDASPKS